ncbi:uncharacterized protein ACA1_144370 [Acanthamoeba castellanii str. Neff]|uniref:Ribosomal protein eL8/eL30/eS12/Gadd45 domain-containing protein n=1 Tax=Acanthamoeba castellanii (strain ATCC 30010 / Neff) TaxID=1257118 RepID=L8HI21_ACACF|nr:uncharacterized protein ACA1_144370 [Acanthamoeba castellanii str. Neff]ELR24046.1 hypothetical protein ACA1_144370 [Acanthamoeba castellanii str. Neff]
MQREQPGMPPPLGRGGQQQRGGGQEAPGRGRGKPKPTKEVQLWDAIVAAAAKQQRRSQHQQHHQQHTRPKLLRPGERPASAPARQQPLKPTTATSPGDAQPSPPSPPAAAAAAPVAVASPAPPKSGKAATAVTTTTATTATTATTRSKGAGGAPRKAKHHHHPQQQQQRQQNTNWASNQRHIAFRGKERETPKPTKPSKLKRVILLERAKADALLQPPPPPTPAQPGTPPPGDEAEAEGQEQEQEDIHATHEAHGRDEPCFPVPGLPSQIDHHHGDGDEAAAGEKTREAYGDAGARGGGGGGSFTDTEVAPLAPPAAAPAEIDHYDYDSPPPSPPPGAAEVQSIDATYCKQVISVELNQVMRQLLQELTRFQERARTKNPDKARSNKKRYVCGLREVLRSVERRKARCVVVTPNIERISSPEGGLFEAVEAIVRTSQQHRIIVIFAMTRTSLGKAISKRLKIAALAILDPSGAEEYYKQALALAHKGRLDYRRMHKRKSQQHQQQQHQQQHQQHNIPKPLPPPSGQPSKAGQPQPPLEEVLPQLIQQVINERLRTELLIDDAT